MNLLKMYFQEKYGTQLIENECGFIMYNAYPDNSVYVRHLYVKPEERGKGIGKALEDRLIEREEPRVIYCDIDLTANNPESSMAQIMYRAGYKIDSVSSSQIILRKDL